MLPYGPRLSDHELRSRLQQRIEDGRLPVALSNNVIAGYGSADICSGCGEQISSDQVEYELAELRDGGQLTFHPSCHAIWQLECVRRLTGQNPCPPSDADQPSHGLTG
jgi:hypothetical protein